MDASKVPECIYQCKTCNKALCSKCAITPKHRVHELEDYLDYKIALANRVRQARTETKQLLVIEGAD